MTLDGWVIAFDLDDTLISEIEYQRSGIASVEMFIESTFAIDFSGRIQSALDAGVKDIWGWACKQLNLPSDVKESLLWVYRLHSPSIHLPSGVCDLLRTLADNGAQLAVLSDGRSVTQRQKLKSVRLEHLPVFISQDYGAEKPDLRGFLAVEERWPRSKYAYVGDNPKKDFQAPARMGWLTIGALWIDPRVHQVTYRQESGCCTCPPSFWCHHPSEVFSLIAEMD